MPTEDRATAIENQTDFTIFFIHIQSINSKNLEFDVRTIEVAISQIPWCCLVASLVQEKLLGIQQQSIQGRANKAENLSQSYILKKFEPLELLLSLQYFDNHRPKFLGQKSSKDKNLIYWTVLSI